MRASLRLPTVLAALSLTATVAAAAAVPAAAQAPGAAVVLSGPADGARLTAGAAPPLRARSASGDTGLELHVSASPQVLDACGRIGAEIATAAGAPDAA